MRFARFVAALLALVVCPSVAVAQASITGTVRDSSGGVLPGVTVEVESPALIERVRSVVTGSNGQYRVVDLRPGAYTVSFELAGFSVVERPGIQLTGEMTVTVNAELRVGALTERITVTGESPLVDVQTVSQQRVLSQEVLQAIPTGNTIHNMVALIPGMNINAIGNPVAQDVGGSTAGVGIQTAAIHGGRPGDQRVMIDGAAVNAGFNGNIGGFSLNTSTTQEVTVETSAAGAESFSGGVRINLIPRQGGNTFSGSLFLTGATSDFQSTNIDDALIARGFAVRDPAKTLKMTRDVNGSIGGPILRDRLWFFSGFNLHRSHNIVAVRENLNAGNASAWLYAPDPNSETQFQDASIRAGSARLTWQATTIHRLAFAHEEQQRCICLDQNASTSPEAATDSKYFPNRMTTLTWTAPFSSRLLLDAGYVNRSEGFGQRAPADMNLDLIRVTDSVLGIAYRGGNTFTENLTDNVTTRASLSYVTGAHAFKTGFTYLRTRYRPTTTSNNHNVAYTFQNGVPNQITLNATPIMTDNRLGDLAFFVQDRWTIDRLTLNLGLRYDNVWTYFPAQALGPAALLPTRNLTISETDWTNWKDLSPRMGFAYDLFGDGRTAVKLAYNRYLATQGPGGNFGTNGNPLNRVPSSTTRAWADANGNFVPDCVLTNFAQNGECGPVANAAFGTGASTFNIDPELLTGWGKRNYNWELSTGVNHQFTSRVSAEFGYFRRTYGNFSVTDNLAVTAADFTAFSVTVPTHPGLPLSGQALSNLFNVNPNRFGQVNNFLTLADNFGDQIERWHGVDLIGNVRALGNVILQGGISTGSTLLDSCDVRQALPETALTNPFCRTEEAFLTQVKGLVSYTVPRVDLQLSGSFQSIPGAAQGAAWNASNALIQPSLGRPLAGNAQTVSITIVEPGSLYRDRTNQLDIRAGKLLRFSGVRASLNVDLFNALNANAVTNETGAFGPAWRQPLAVLPGRLLKISGRLEF